ncbi:MAG: hypothetical protein ABEJ35_03860 [Halobacteriaceae archaeon]
MGRTPTPATIAGPPSLDDGLVHLTAPSCDQPAAPRTTRATGLHELVASVREDRSAPVYWLDARNAASTYGLAAALGPHHLESVQVARAFTAYQHYDLVRRVVRTVTEPGLIVAPNLAALYRDDDVPAGTAGPLFRTAVRVLHALGRSTATPVVVTAAGDDQFTSALERAAVQTVTCERTRCGLRLSTASQETLVYRMPGWWQTTVPYWVDLAGAVTDDTPPSVPAHHQRPDPAMEVRG